MNEDMIRKIVSEVVDEILPPEGTPSGTDTAPCAPCEGSGYSVPAEASGRHVHLSETDLLALFGKGYALTPKRGLSQPGQFLSEERVTLIGPKGVFSNVAVLGPTRGATQVEVSLSDARVLGIEAPIALSGDLSHAADIVISSGSKTIQAKGSVIVARNHVHLSPDEAKAAGVEDGDLVAIRVKGERPLTFDRVPVRSGSGHKAALHLDFDEANACALKPGTTAEILGKVGRCPAKAKAEQRANPTTNDVAVGPEDVLISTGFLTEEQVKNAVATGCKAIVVPQKTVVSPLAKDCASKNNVTIKKL